MIKINGNHHALEMAARWLRQTLNIPPHNTVFDEFEHHFNCKITVDDRTDSWMMPNYVEFFNEQDAMLFLLKWAC